MGQTLPLTRREIMIGGRVWLVDTVDDQDALLRAAETSAQFPFGLMLWESAIALAEELYARRSLLTGKPVLELGAGLGLSGVVAASLGAIVAQTDHDRAALTASARTAKINGVTGIGRAPGDWHSWNDDTRFDLILGADIIYDGNDHAALLTLFERRLRPCGHVLLADPGRAKQAPFLASALATGWTITRSIRRVSDLNSAIEGALIEIDIMDLQRN